MLFEKPILILVSRLQQFLDEARRKFILIARFSKNVSGVTETEFEETRPRWHVRTRYKLIKSKTT